MLPDYDYVQVNYDMGDLRNDGVEINFNILISKNTEMKMKLMYKELADNQQWWDTASSEDIYNEIKSIVGNTTNGNLQPKHCTSHTHRKAESFMIYQLYLSIMRYHSTPTVEAAHSLIFHEHFNNFNVRTFSNDELDQHIQTNNDKVWW